MGIRAIVIDDNKDIQNVFAELLYFNNVDVVGKGSNGQEAVELYKKLHPDIVFIDAMMPKYNGFYGLEKIREYDPKSTIVLVTGSINVEDEIDGCGASAILPKPIDMIKIMNVVKKFCIH
ncbi:MAG: response regulator [Nitrosotalea sp.]